MIEINKSKFISNKMLNGENGLYTVNNSIYNKAINTYVYEINPNAYKELYKCAKRIYECDDEMVNKIFAESKITYFYAPYFKHKINLNSFKLIINDFQVKSFEMNYKVDKQIDYIYDLNYYLYNLEIQKIDKSRIKLANGNEVFIRYSFNCDESTIKYFKDPNSKCAYSYVEEFEDKLIKENKDIMQIRLKELNASLDLKFDMYLIPIVNIIAKEQEYSFCYDCTTCNNISYESCILALLNQNEDVDEWH